jgi:hypothetical protein
MHDGQTQVNMHIVNLSSSWSSQASKPHDGLGFHVSLFINMVNNKKRRKKYLIIKATTQI